MCSSDLSGSLFALGGLAFLAGCGDEVKEEFSPVLQEEAQVVDLVHTPSRHDSSVMIIQVATANGNGGVTINNMVVPIVNDVPEKYGLVFRCPHGKFITESTGEPHKSLYNNLTTGQKVNVTYHEIYRSTYKDTNNDGKKELVEKHLVKYDFRNAEPITSQPSALKTETK